MEKQQSYNSGYQTIKKVKQACLNGITTSSNGGD